MPLHRRVPKRGFHNPFRTEYASSTSTPWHGVRDGGGGDAGVLRERGLLSGGKLPVKVLGRGEIAMALTVKADKFSGKAAEKIQAAGGNAETLGAAK